MTSTKTEKKKHPKTAHAERFENGSHDHTDNLEGIEPPHESAPAERLPFYQQQRKKSQ